MALEKDSIKDLFSSKLGSSFEPEVPASIWSGIDQLLPKEPSGGSSSSSSSSSPTPSPSSTMTSTITSSATKAVIGKGVAIVAGAAAVVTATVLVVSDDQNEKEPQADNKIETVFASQDTLSVEEYDVDTVLQIVPTDPYVNPVVAQRTTNRQKDTAKALVSQSQNVFSDEIKEEKQLPISIEETGTKKEEVNELLDQSSLANIEDVEVEPIAIFNGVSIGIRTGTGLMRSSKSQQGGLLSFSDRNLDVEKLIGTSENVYSLKHNQPISFGLTLSKRLSRSISIETGLLYTYLSSDIKSSTSLIIDQKESFHYLGIPLFLNYDFYQIGKTRLYISAGWLVQKDVKGSYTTAISESPVRSIKLQAIDGRESDLLSPGIASDRLSGYLYYLEENINQNNPQFSAHLTLGVSYPIYKKLYLYGTFGGAYFFDAGNAYRTIYSDRKFQLDLNAGLKIDF